MMFKLMKNVNLCSTKLNKASEGDGIPVELFQILKDCESAALNMPAKLESSAVATGLEKVSFHSNPKAAQMVVSACNAGDPGSIPGLGRSPREGNSNPLQDSCLENPMDGGAW